MSSYKAKAPQCLSAPPISLPKIYALPLTVKPGAVKLPRAEPTKRGALMLATDANLFTLDKLYSANNQNYKLSNSIHNLKPREHKTAVPKFTRVCEHSSYFKRL